MILLSRAVEVKMPTSDLCACRKYTVTEQLWLSKWQMTQGGLRLHQLWLHNRHKEAFPYCFCQNCCCRLKGNGEQKCGSAFCCTCLMRNGSIVAVWRVKTQSDNMSQGPCEPLWWAGHSNPARRGRRWEPSSLWRQQHPPSGYKHPDWKRGKENKT